MVMEILNSIFSMQIEGFKSYFGMRRLEKIRYYVIIEALYPPFNHELGIHLLIYKHINLHAYAFGFFSTHTHKQTQIIQLSLSLSSWHLSP